jgi:mannose-6-phosphate isomerase-like protein (cupin superfamily)
MKKINIYNPPEGQGLAVNSDARGTIADVFYNTSINHVCVIHSNPEAVRGNHYHNHTVQHTLLTKGQMRYWWKPVDSSEPAQCVDLEAGDLVTSERGEIHTLQFLDEVSECVVFTEGERGGVDYEKDTHRVDNIIYDVEIH